MKKIIGVVAVLFLFLIVGIGVYSDSTGGNQLPTVGDTSPSVASKNIPTPSESNSTAQQKSIQAPAVAPVQPTPQTVDISGTLVQTPIQITSDSGNSIYLIVLKVDGVTTVLNLNKYTRAFAGTKGDGVEVKGVESSPISYCHGTDASLAHWCSLLDLTDGDQVVIPNYINNLNPDHPSTVYSTHY